MKKFAKLFETELGQILVMRESDNDEGDAVSFYFDAGVAGLSTTKTKLGFENEEDADDTFEEMDETKAQRIVGEMIQEIQAMFKEHLQ
jgi:hypothetical protein